MEKAKGYFDEDNGLQGSQHIEPSPIMVVEIQDKPYQVTVRDIKKGQAN